ncbi:HAD-IIA family hydrolase [Aureimonas psammosilenae]|uniref:HAD-IIA family hydrolase n=1 Tax=Aureimonas psammosilenae TaxID=2495496 RepID=UPI0012606717|nr:HAD-IIA family hydrolase [Aureimonas psammosilenae]
MTSPSTVPPVPPEALREETGVSVAPQTTTLKHAFARYEAIRERLPAMPDRGPPVRMENLLDTAERFDAYLFDSFGVLNVGDTAIPGAAQCLSALRAMGKPFCVLTNAASYTGEAALAKYRRMGLDVRRGEVVSSRDIAFRHLDALAPGIAWAAISAEGDGFEDTDARLLDLLDRDEAWSAAEGFMFLSSARWNERLQDRLVAELSARPRPLVVANPDLVAPREDGLTLEPGWWCHDIQDRTTVRPHFFGKPYAAAFELAAERLGPGRIAMVGDTLHTDILGGAAAGCGTILVTRHGILAGSNADEAITRSGIVPDVVIPSI